MMKPDRLISRLALALAVLIFLANSVPAQAANPAQTAGIYLTGPTACPANGCAPGQRLSYRLEFGLGQYNPSDTKPNVKVCVYYPKSWNDPTAIPPPDPLDQTGGITGKEYTPTKNCTDADNRPPAKYVLASAGAATINDYQFHDTLGFNFRIAAAALTGPGGSILLRVFEQIGPDTAPNWVKTLEGYTPNITIAPPLGPNIYVISDPAACPSGGDCYLNSAGDESSGLGTGLKDAIDAAPVNTPDTVITIIGSITVKKNTVLVDEKLTIAGSADAAIVSSDTDCNNSMLTFTKGGLLHNLNISDASCTTTLHRDLISVDTDAPLAIESNDLTSGANAIHVLATSTGGLTVRYNNITGSTAHALFWEGTDQTAALNLIANNIVSITSVPPVDCASSAAATNRRANHNYWGSLTAPPNTHCVIDAGKQLGAPILVNASAPGVSAENDSVTKDKVSLFNNLIELQQGGTVGAKYSVYLINHGTDLPSSIPFTGTSSRSPDVCSNAWDIFLDPDVAAPATGATLELFVKYNRSPACITAIESSTFCGQTTTPAKYPMYWLAPSGAITSGWNTTGQNPDGASANSATGQTTACDTVNDEIHVTIDNSGRPALNSDLNFTPFLVGVPVPSSYKLYASNQTVTVTWSTSSEPDISGFYVQRSPNGAEPFAPISDLIAHKGSALYGSSYAFTDSGRTNGTTYFYRLKTVRSDSGYFYSDTLSIKSDIATATLSPTPYPTITPYPSSTPYPSWTPYYVYPSSTRYATSTRLFVTSTYAPSLGTSTPYGATSRPTSLTAVNPLTQTIILAGTGSDIQIGTGYPAPGTGDNGTLLPTDLGTPGTPGTPSTLTTQTPLTPTPNQADKIRSASDWISMVMGFLMSTGVVGVLAWLIFFRKKTPLS